MKRDFILFIIGLLVGAVIASGAFYVYTTTLNINCGEMPQNGGQPPEMQNGGQPPEMPNGQPPERPDNQNGMNNQQANTQESA